MKDPFEILGVAHDATLGEIKQAYRRLAKELHPDLNRGDDGAERFKDVSTAYVTLIDPEKRARAERSEWGPGRSKRERGFPGNYGGPHEDPGSHAADEKFGSGAQFHDLFGDIAGNRRGRGGTSMWLKGEDMAESMTVSFIEAAVGAVKPLTLVNLMTVEIQIPAGARQSETVTVAGQGFPGFGGGPPGDLNVILEIEPHAVLSRDVFDVRMDLSLTAAERQRGARVTVPTIGGDMALEVPKGSHVGDRVAMRGMGFKDPVSNRRGDHIVTLTRARRGQAKQG